MQPALANSRFLKACRREAVDATPVWIMRQAGRYLPEYMAVRSKVRFLDLCEKPELSAQVTLDAQRLLDVDAAILFADLLPILQPMGLDLEYQQGEGPIIHNPLRGPHDVDRLKPLEDVSPLSFTMDAVRLIRRELPAHIPLIGFAGLPFTLASYAIEGGGSRNYLHTKSLMYGDAGAWHTLMTTLADSVIKYINAQVAAGCQAVQLFDSWAGCLSPHDYIHYVQPYATRVLSAVTPGVPVIHFLHGNPALLTAARDAGGTVIGVDWRTELAPAWDQLGQVAVQGNLDPVTLFSQTAWRDQATRILQSVRGRNGHIFNLGHGVLPETPAQHVKDLVQLVRETTGNWAHSQ